MFWFGSFSASRYFSSRGEELDRKYSLFILFGTRAAQSPTVEDDFVLLVAITIESKCGGVAEFASRARIRRVCSYLGKPNYGERWWQIKLKMAGVALDSYRPSTDLVLMLKKLFTLYVFAGNWILEKTTKWYPRRTLLSYNYVYCQLLRIIDAWMGTDFFLRHSWYFVNLKTRNKVKVTDERWKHIVDKICEDRKWIPEDDKCLPNQKWPYLPLYPVLYGTS